MKMLLFSDFITWFFDFLGITATNISECLKEWFGWDVSPAFIKILAVVIFVIVLLIILYFRLYKRKLKTKKWRRNLIEQKLGTEFRLYTEQKQNFFKRVLSRLKESSKQNIYIETRFQSNPPHDKLDPEENIHTEPSESLMKFYLEQVLVKNNATPFLYCVLAGSGMGKTTFAINLLKKYINKYTEDTIPFDIYIYNLGNNVVFDKINNVNTEVRPQSILILDALDENTFATHNYERFKEQLENLVKDFRIVIITCRTQFFDDENKEPNKSSLSYYNGGRTLEHYHKHYISVFNEKDIKTYLKQKYPINIKKRKKAASIVRKCNSLMVRPLLLSYIDDLMQEDEEKLSSVTNIYEILIEKWINREVEFWETKNKNQIDSELLKKELYSFSKQLAKEIYERKEKYGGLFIPKNDLDSIIKNSIIEFNVYDFKGRSLVNRDAIGNIKFAHKSFLEFFLAKLMFKGEISISFEGMDMALKFYLDFLDKEMKYHYRESVIINTNDDERILTICKPFRIKSWMKEYFQHIQWLFVASECVPSVYILIKESKIKYLVIYNSFLASFPLSYTNLEGFSSLPSIRFTYYRKMGEMMMAFSTMDLSNNQNKYKLITRLIEKRYLIGERDLFQSDYVYNDFLLKIVGYEFIHIINSCLYEDMKIVTDIPHALINYKKLEDTLTSYYDFPLDINELTKKDTLYEILDYVMNQWSYGCLGVKNLDLKILFFGEESDIDSRIISPEYPSYT